MHSYRRLCRIVLGKSGVANLKGSHRVAAKREKSKTEKLRKMDMSKIEADADLKGGMKDESKGGSNRRLRDGSAFAGESQSGRGSLGGELVVNVKE